MQLVTAKDHLPKTKSMGCLIIFQVRACRAIHMLLSAGLGCSFGGSAVEWLGRRT